MSHHTALTRRRVQSLPVQMAELAVAVPQVMAHRVTRLALVSTPMSARDQREFSRMSSEKAAALQESWLAIGVQLALAQQQFALAFVRSATSFGTLSGAATAAAMTTQLTRAGLGLLDHGLAPLHRRTMANARRLRRTPIR